MSNAGIQESRLTYRGLGIQAGDEQLGIQASRLRYLGLGA